MRLTFILALTCLISLSSFKLTAQVTAIEPAGSGTVADPYQITSFENLFWISDLAVSSSDRQNRNTAHYIQLNDIDASESATIALGFNPIGLSPEGGFTGSYDGQGFRISNLETGRDTSLTGFFAEINGGEVENLTLTNATFSVDANSVGVLAGKITNSSSINNCSVENSNVTVDGSGSGSVGNIGGMFGEIENSTVQNSSVINTIISTTSANRVGGFVGRTYNSAIISTSFVNMGEVIGNDDVGGFVGFNGEVFSNPGSTISNSYSRTTVKTENGIAAGFVGSIDSGSIVNSYTTSSLEILNSGTGTLYAFGDQTGVDLVTNSFYDTDITSTDNSDATGETTVNLNLESTFLTAGWDFVCETANGTDDIWNIDATVNDGYPNFESDQIIPVSVAPTGTGTSLDPYLITSLENLLWISENPSSWSEVFEQTANIDAASTEFWGCSGTDGGWIVIANDLGESFSGSYNGGGFTIENLFIDSSQSNVGLFGNLSGEVFDLNLTNFSISADSNTGALAGTLQTGATITSVFINQGTITSTATGLSNVGGVFGELEGGLVTTSYSTASVNGDENVGGFVGLVSGGEINNSYVRGEVNGITNAAGFAGSITGGLIDKSYAANAVVASGVSEDPAGFANQTGVDLVTNSFYDSDITSTDNSDATGETTANLNLESIFLTASWDFVCETDNGTDDIWRIASTENDGYPIFNSNFELPDLSPAGDGTSGNPYLIANLGNLIWLANNDAEWDKFYLQTADIDLSATIEFECDGDNAFQIIAQGELEAFSGNYNAQNFTLSNLNLDFSDNRIGFFGTLDNATISNFNFVNASVTGNSNLGVLAGVINNNSSIENCSIDGTVAQNNGIDLENIGGLAGSISNSSVSNITLGDTSLSITSFGNYAGGLVGRATSTTITSVSLFGSLNSAGNHVGGLSGKINSSSLSSITSSITITGNSFVGGIIGEANTNSEIANVTATGDLTVNSTSSKIGGLVGYLLNSQLTTASNFTASITASSSDEVGGVVGKMENSTLLSLSPTPNEITGNNQVGGVVGLALNSSIENINVKFNSINAANQVGGVVGLFDQSTVTNASSLFNTLENNQITANNQVGGVFGRVQGDVSGDGVSISSITSQVAINGNELVGGLIGDIDANLIIEGIVLSQVSLEAESKVGGLIGQTSTGVTLQQVGVSNVDISGVDGSLIGGLIGVSNGTVIESYVKSFSINYATSLTNAGGFVGQIDAGNVTDNYVLSTSASPNPFSNVAVTNSAGFVGNAVGGTISRAYAAVNSSLNGFTGTGIGTTINNSFYDEDLAGGSTDTSASATSSSNMNLEATFTAAGWDFECEIDNGTLFTWGINTTDNEAYAFLRWEGFESECVFDANWIGVTSSDWSDASNWAENIVPGADEDISIPVSAPNYPLLDQNRSIQNLFIEDGATLSIGENNTLTLKGNIVGLGTIIGSMSSSLLVNGNGEVTLQMNQNTPEVSNMLFNLILQGGVTNELLLILENSVFVNNLLSLESATTSLQSDLNLTLYCDFNSSNLKVAQVDQQLGEIIGGLVAEQCFPARRAFRLISPSLSMLGSIQNNWQESASTHNDSSVPTGYGTHITGNAFESSTPTLNEENNGFDWNPSGAPSMFSFFSTTQNWAPANRTTTSLAPRDARRLMIRGDRSINIMQNDAVPTNTKLRTRGTPDDTDNFVVNFDHNYAEGDLILVGNPFWAQVDIAPIINNEQSLLNYFYYWDPSLGGTPLPGEPGGRGAWVAYLTGDFDEISAGTSLEYNLNGETSSSTSSQVSNLIQPMQAIMLVASGGSVSISYNQSDKAVEDTQVQVFSDQNISKKRIDVNLFKQNDASTPLDAYRLIFMQGANNDIGAGDIPKLDNIDENICTIQNGQLLAIQLRDLPTSNECVNMFINNYKHTAYRLQIDIDSFDDLDAYLLDLYTNEEILLIEGENNYAFDVDSNINSSTAFNRFQIEFRETLSINDNVIQDVKLYPNPVVDDFNLVMSDLVSNYNFTIYDLVGNPITPSKYTVFKEGNVLSILNFNEAPGIYFIKVVDNKQTVNTLKFIKK